jgi:hypothetical protein
MKKLIFILVSSWLVYGSSAFAACNRADVAGTWNIYFGIGSAVARCTLKVPHIGIGSSCYIPGVVSSIPLTGDLALRRNCNVSGKVLINGTELTVDGWISRDKENISGMSWFPIVSVNPLSNVGGVFSGVKK